MQQSSWRPSLFSMHKQAVLSAALSRCPGMDVLQEPSLTQKNCEDHSQITPALFRKRASESYRSLLHRSGSTPKATSLSSLWHNTPIGSDEEFTRMEEPNDAIDDKSSGDGREVSRSNDKGDDRDYDYGDHDTGDDSGDDGASANGSSSDGNHNNNNNDDDDDDPKGDEQGYDTDADVEKAMDEDEDEDKDTMAPCTFEESSLSADPAGTIETKVCDRLSWERPQEYLRESSDDDDDESLLSDMSGRSLDSQTSTETQQHPQQTPILRQPDLTSQLHARVQEPVVVSPPSPSQDNLLEESRKRGHGDLPAGGFYPLSIIWRLREEERSVFQRLVYEQLDEDIARVMPRSHDGRLIRSDRMRRCTRWLERLGPGSGLGSGSEPEPEPSSLITSEKRGRRQDDDIGNPGKNHSAADDDGIETEPSCPSDPSDTFRHDQEGHEAK
ncbi:hypothetical protein BGX31_010110 [Mortierella sp. GBA43]|nr:hypothetical protein BGX31_010110 [Mortierella sp. GBA43]